MINYSPQRATQAWLEKNPDTDFIVRDQDQLVGFIDTRLNSLDTRLDRVETLLTQILARLPEKS